MYGSMYVFVMCAVVALIIWGLFALGTQGTQSTTKQPGHARSERGATLIQAFFWIVVLIAFVGVIASSP